ncbi:MAG TPA: hypothetical protein VF062_28860 [Candidatus Limnocylindrales bacterium]
MAGKVFRRQTGKAAVYFEVEKENGDLLRFDCRPSIPGGLILAFSDLAAPDADGSDEDRIAAGRGAIKIVKDLLRAAIVPAQQELFWSMLDGTSADGMIDVETMMEIADYLGEAYAERPTGPSSGAGSPTTSSGSPSRDGAPGAVLTYSRLTPVEPSISSSTGQRSVPL